MTDPTEAETTNDHPNTESEGSSVPNTLTGAGIGASADPSTFEPEEETD
ncbi:hypothetical protein [Nakamurella antarctica]|nr:hypothetical protein [Nakamurella antarctica]